MLLFIIVCCYGFGLFIIFRVKRIYGIDNFKVFISFSLVVIKVGNYKWEGEVVFFLVFIL